MKAETLLADHTPGYIKSSREYPFLRGFEAGYEAIRRAYEFIDRNQMMVVLPGVVENSAVQKNSWYVFPIYVNCNYDFYLEFLSYKTGVDVRAVLQVLRENMPEVFQALEQADRDTPIINATFYRMKPQTVLRLHADSGDYQYRAHMGITVPEGNCALRVRDSVVKWKEGRFLVFDSTQPHMAWNLTNEERIVFSIDFFKKPFETNRDVHIAEVRRRMEVTPLGFEGGGYLPLDAETNARHNRLVDVVEI